MSDVTGTNEPLDVHIVTPEREVWAGSASFVLARSANGDIGVLPGHEPTLALLGAGPLEIKTGKATETWGVEGGFLSIGTTAGHTRVDVLAERVTERAEEVHTHSGAIAPDGPIVE